MAHSISSSSHAGKPPGTEQVYVDANPRSNPSMVKAVAS